MKNIILPIQKTQSLYRVMKEGSRPLFDPMDVAGNAERVSCCPNRWAEINNFDCVEVTQFEKPNGMFVNITKLMDDDKLHEGMRMMLLDAERQGLVTFTDLFRVNYSQDRSDIGSSFHRTELEAMAVAFDNGSLVSKEKQWVGTPKLAKLLGISDGLAISKGETYAVIAMLNKFSQDGMPIDGIYWKGQDGVPSNGAYWTGMKSKGSEKTQASFMAIFPHKMNGWSQTNCLMPASDQPLLGSLPRGQHMNMPTSRGQKKSTEFGVSM